MENASKALLMAAGVLIGIMVLSLAVYLFVTFGSTSAQMHQQKEQDQLNQFNSQFTSYEGKEDITIYDIVTVANLATENNKYYEFDTMDPSSEETNNNYIWVEIYRESYGGIYSYGKEKSIKYIKGQYEKLISEELRKIDKDHLKLPTYKCKTSINSITGRVYMVRFELNK